MRTIRIPVKKSPENFVRNYITHRIGSNVRLGSTKKNNDGTWSISLNAIVPSFVKLRDSKSKTFVYVFKNISKATVKYDDYDYDFITKPNAADIDIVLINKINELTEDIQKEILNYGKFEWGKLTSIKFWLGPIFNILIRSLDENVYSFNKIDDKYVKYYNLLKKNQWINVEGRTQVEISVGNKLAKMHETLITEGGIKDDVISIAEVVLGHVYSKNYKEIRDELNVRGIAAHVTTTKAYYADAVREGKSIPMTRETLWHNYRTYNYTHKPPQFKVFSFPRTIAELVSIGILQTSSDRKYILAAPKLLEKLLPFQAQLAQNELML